MIRLLGRKPRRKSGLIHLYNSFDRFIKKIINFSLRTRQDLEQLTKKTKTFYSILKPSDTNKAVKNFIPLRLEDTGMYFCISFKYLLFKAIYINVGNNTQTHIPFKNSFNSLSREECGPKMFQCILNGVCINQVYVCDGHKDCPDGSDEAFEKCDGDPCRGNIFLHY